ncbi:MAG: hypothetical protein IJ784_07510 [Ruminiclostridium sp.]|uniref:hypothetical protein n=1 Tax=Ruminococcus sp. TaxID=41978 RepID=UPI0025E53A16|nr:hypothetical protein [Ruminococcus sp.]MBR1431389.1 hypothetical protein [Ruminococcus sp.]MBR1832263.1 hypothetical protein [Ruminiclostridium sp.]
MRNYGLTRYMTYNNYRHSSLYNHSRVSTYKQFAWKSNSANVARKAYQTTSAAKTTYTTNLSDAVSGIASSVSDLSKAMSGTDREKMFDAAKSFVDSYNDMYSAVSNSRNSFVSGRTSVMTNTAKAYSGTLEKAGVTVGKDGKLSIDKEKFMEADDKALSSALGRNSTFTGSVVSQAVNVSRYSDNFSYTSYGGYNSYGGYSKNSLFDYAVTTQSGVLAEYLLNQWI